MQTLIFFIFTGHYECHRRLFRFWSGSADMHHRHTGWVSIDGSADKASATCRLEFPQMDLLTLHRWHTRWVYISGNADLHHDILALGEWVSMVDLLISIPEKLSFWIPYISIFHKLYSFGSTDLNFGQVGELPLEDLLKCVTEHGVFQSQVLNWTDI